MQKPIRPRISYSEAKTLAEGVLGRLANPTPHLRHVERLVVFGSFAYRLLAVDDLDVAIAYETKDVPIGPHWSQPPPQPDLAVLGAAISPCRRSPAACQRHRAPVQELSRRAGEDGLELRPDPVGETVGRAQEPDRRPPLVGDASGASGFCGLVRSGRIDADIVGVREECRAEWAGGSAASFVVVERAGDEVVALSAVVGEPTGRNDIDRNWPSSNDAQWGLPGSTETGLVGFLFSINREALRAYSRCRDLLLLGWGHASERGVQPFGVEPGDVLDDRELELGAAAPDAVADQLGLEAVDEALGERVVEGVPDGADRGEQAVVVEGLAVLERGVLGGFNRSSQHLVMEVVRDGWWQASAGDSCDAWPDLVAGAAFGRAA